MFKLITALFITLVFISACGTEEKPEEQTPTEPAQIINASAVLQIDSTLNAFIESGTLAGLSALIYEDGKEVYYNAFGLADREAETPMDRNTIVQIFSMTKPITGVALMQLYEQGKFKLDDPVSKYAPEFSSLKVYEGMDDNGDAILVEPNRPMTIRDLTRHTSGLGPCGAPYVDSLVRLMNPMDDENTLTEMAEQYGALPLCFHPGDQWYYGPSVDVQAFLVERISGEPFDSYVRNHILNPLGMTKTRYFVPEVDRPRLSGRYNRADDGTLTQVPNEQAFRSHTKHWALTRGGSGLTSTLDDYMRFAQMLVHEGELDGVRILEAETVKLMATNHLADSVTERLWLPSKGQVGFGIDFAVRIAEPVDKDENYGIVGEFFWDGAASTLFWVDPVNELTAVLFVQLRPYDQVGLHKKFRDAVYGE